MRVQRCAAVGVVVGAMALVGPALANAKGSPGAGPAQARASTTKTTATTSPQSSASTSALPAPSTVLALPVVQSGFAAPQPLYACEDGCDFSANVGNVHRHNGKTNTAEGIIETVAGAGSGSIGVGSTLLCVAAAAEPELDVMLTGHCVLAGGTVIVSSAVVLGDGLYNLFGSL